MISFPLLITAVIVSCALCGNGQHWSARQITTNPDRIQFLDDDRNVQSAGQTLDSVDTQIANGIQQMTLQMITPDKESTNENVLFSPTSIAMTLAMVLLGASGQTSTEIQRVLGLSRNGVSIGRREELHQKYGALLSMVVDSSTASTQTTLATAIFVQRDYRISESYQRKSQEIYKSDVVSLNFKDGGDTAKDTINSWVASRTAGRINDLLHVQPSRETKVLLASTLYFNGEWEIPFPEVYTRRRPFYVSSPAGNDVIEVPLMVNAAELPYYQDRSLGCSIVSLPYKGRHISMHVILPTTAGFEALQTIGRNLRGSVLDGLIANTAQQMVIVTLPRMKLESSISLKTTLKSMGMKSLFNWGTSDLSQITNGIDWSSISNSSNFVKGRNVGQRGSNPGLYVDDVVHKVEVEVTETGTVGSAATALSVSRTGSIPSFRADRPFMFLIRHEKTKMILFWGTVIRPTF